MLAILFWSSNTAVLAQSGDRPDKISILYTGKSLGVLGNTRFQEEHEILTEAANELELEFKLVSHACWRAKGITIFLPSDEPEGGELELILEKKEQWSVLDSLPAILSQDGLLLQDPNRTEVDMMNLIKQSDRTSTDFPDFQNTMVGAYEMILGQDSMPCFIVVERGAIWPLSEAHWEIGEINRIDYGKTSRMFELPINQGNFGARSSRIKSLIAADDSRFGFILADMGHRHGDFDLNPVECTKVDFEGLHQLNYQILVPYQQELIIGSDALQELSQQYPDIKLLSTNIESDNEGLFRKSIIARYDSLAIGFIGLTDPELEYEMPKQLLDHYTFRSITEASKEAIASLRIKDVDVIVALSNMHPSMNATLAENVKGIDFIVADFSNSNSILEHPMNIEGLLTQRSRPNIPHYIARSNDYGIAMGRLDLYFDKPTKNSSSKIASAKHQLYPINDRIQADTSLMMALRKDLHLIKRPKGELLFPAFVDILEQEPSLKNFDEVTKNGRISKPLWEDFLARLVRNGVPAEISILRRVSSFLPQIGKLHEKEVRSWLWMEDDIVMMDVLGRDLARFLEAEIDEHYVTSGITSFSWNGRRIWMVMGRFMLPNAYYRVATTNVIRDGASEEYFARRLRSHDLFTINKDGSLNTTKSGSSIKLRDYVLSELKYVRSLGKGKIHHSNIASLLKPDPRFEKLTTFNFNRPTLWSSLNRSYKEGGYESVPESRILSPNSFVLGISGGIQILTDKVKSSWDLDVNFAFAQQSAETENGTDQLTENADDLRIGLTYRLKGKNRKGLQPFLRALYDTEFTATENMTSGIKNPQQQIGRGIIGLARMPGMTWRQLEIGFTAENDFSNQNRQLGIQGRSLLRLPLNKSFSVTYVLRNDFNFFFDAPNDSARDLTYKYNMVHELLVPLFGDISLSVGADLFFFKGKVDINNDPGFNMLMKVGITYDRLWKPRFQPLF